MVTQTETGNGIMNLRVGRQYVKLKIHFYNLLDEHSNKMSPSDLLSYPLLTEASICSGWLLTHIFITGQYAENKGPCFIEPLA